MEQEEEEEEEEGKEAGLVDCVVAANEDGSAEEAAEGPPHEITLPLVVSATTRLRPKTTV